MSSSALKSAATGGEVADAKDKKPTTLTQLMADPRTKAQIALALPKHMTADRLARIAMTELRKTPKLMQCDQMSFLGAIMQCAQLGLEPGGALGHAYLLPFDRRQKQGNQWVTVATEAQLIIGYRGMIDLARRSGQIVSLSARAVHENDTFSYAYGLEEKLEHVPCEDGNPGALTHVYAVARLKDGGVQFEVMSKTAVDKVRALSKSGDKGPWVEHYEEMAKKTAIRCLFKYLPVSIELQRAVNIDEKAESDIPQDNASVITGEYSVIDDYQSDTATHQAGNAEQ
ncbi:recombination protein RecT [Cronobacter dublinensis]